MPQYPECNENPIDDYNEWLETAELYNPDGKKKKAKQLFSEWADSIPDIQIIKNSKADIDLGTDGKGGIAYHVDMVDEILNNLPEFCVVDTIPVQRNWTKPALTLMMSKIDDLEKDWQEKTIDRITHTNTDFTDLDAQFSAMVCNTFKDADFTNAKFNEARIASSKFNDCKFIDCEFVKVLMGRSTFENCTFENVDFSKSDLKNSIFRECKFKDCIFINTTFYQTDLHDCEVSKGLFNTELWYNCNLKRTKIEDSEFNKSQFKGLVIHKGIFNDNAFLKCTYFGSEIRLSEFRGNEWLKVGFANGNSLMNTIFYNENIQQCNFMDSEWKRNEFQESQMLKNDLSEIDMYENNFVGVNGLSLNMARGVITHCKFVDCDLGGLNCTSADFISGSTMENCSLDQAIYAYADMPEGYEKFLKIGSVASIEMLEDRDLHIVSDKEHERHKKTGESLRNLSDRDASVLCELAYEEMFFNTVSGEKEGKSIAELLYDENGIILQNVSNNLSSSGADDYKNYSDYYYPILDKYKLVATSVEHDKSHEFGGISYFAIVVANKDDEKNKGVYIINRGTDQPYDFYDDFKMGAGKLIPSSKIIPHMLQGLDFAHIVMTQYKPKDLGFSGHSLGGSIAQIQTVCFFDNTARISLSPTKCFEPFGTRSEVDPSIAIQVGDTYFTSTLDIWTSFKNWTNILSFGYLFDDWKSIEMQLMENYQKNSSFINGNVKNFARHGDVVAELSAQVGNVVPLATAMPNSVYEDVPKQISGLFAVPESVFAPLVRFNLHRMMWYRYNQYSSDGTLVVGGVNTENVAILQQSKDAKTITNYNAVFAKDLKV